MKLDSQWIVGFVDGEGCFHVGINKNSEMKIGYQVLPEFTIVQHVRDVQLLHALKSYFDCGVVRRNHGDRMAFRIRNLNNLLEIVIPFFEKHILRTKKNVDFLKFRKVVLLMKEGVHLTEEGLNQIRGIQQQMNNLGKLR